MLFFLAPRTRKPIRPATDVEATKEHKLEHGQMDDEVQGVSDKEKPEQGGEDEAEGRTAKAAKDPGGPSAAGVAKHAVSHWPYRSWCSHCVKGRGRSRLHKAAADTERTTPVLSADYCFVGGERAENESPVLMMIDSETSRMFAHVCRK